MTWFAVRTLVLFALLSSTTLADRQLFKHASSVFSDTSFYSSKNEASINGNASIINGNASIINGNASIINGNASNGNRWAVLVAGSGGWDNYRHQADICHAYQILKKGGLKDENIVVFISDDIAFNAENPRPGVIINKPNGDDVYYGVPKDYTGKDCNAGNFLAVLSGNTSALTGGSGKVVNSGPDDYIFVYYADHGSSGFVCMPYGEYLYANDLIETLKKKHAANSYKKMVIYLEACESGSMFDGLLPDNINIYAVTASNPNENSYGFYCPGDFPTIPEEYNICLGDLFSVSWMEDSDLHDAGKETLTKQYQVVKRRTLCDNLDDGSHVMRYGDLKISKDFLSVYIGRNPATENNIAAAYPKNIATTPIIQRNNVSQRDTELLYFKHKVNKAPEGSTEKKEALEKLRSVEAQRAHVDATMGHIAKSMFGESKSNSILKLVRPQGQPLVDDWGCFKSMVTMYEEHCGALGSYGRRYTRALANMCNAGATVEKMADVAAGACSKLIRLAPIPPPRRHY